MPAHLDYVFDALDFSEDSEDAKARRTGFATAMRHTFHDGKPDETFLKHWETVCRTDDVRCTGAWLPEGVFGAGPIPVATFASFAKTINTGRELLPLHMITDVTTSPAHRRRGLVRRLMTDDLASAAERGLPLAALTASEATIYGRWGFGVATFNRTIEVDTGPRFGMRDFTDPGRVELVEPAEAWPTVAGVAERFHAATRGSVGWPHFYEIMHSGAYDFDSGPDTKLRCAVHLAADETVDGVVLFKVTGDGDDKRQLRITEMMALTSSAHLGLWQFLGGVDLVRRVRFSPAPLEDPLVWALRDFNAVKRVGEEEFLWLRVLDVERSLAARPWAADGRVVIEVDDALGHAAGRFEISTGDAVATVGRTDAEPEIRMDAETLGTLYLSTVGVPTLHAAGRLVGSEEAIARFAAMADLPGAPYSLTGF